MRTTYSCFRWFSLRLYNVYIKTNLRDSSRFESTRAKALATKVSASRLLPPTHICPRRSFPKLPDQFLAYHVPTLSVSNIYAMLSRHTYIYFTNITNVSFKNIFNSQTEVSSVASPSKKVNLPLKTSCFSFCRRKLHSSPIERAKDIISLPTYEAFRHKYKNIDGSNAPVIDGMYKLVRLASGVCIEV